MSISGSLVLGEELSVEPEIVMKMIHVDSCVHDRILEHVPRSSHAFHGSIVIASFLVTGQFLA